MRIRVAEIGRYPVKSMLGEQPRTAELTEVGVVGDRAWAVVDVATGKVGSAKHPRLWRRLLDLRAAYDGCTTGRVVITFPDGATAASDDPDVDARVSAYVGRDVRLVGQVPADATYDEEWPDVEGLAPPEFIAGTSAGTSPGGLDLSALPVGMFAPGTFQDVAPVTLMTTASLRKGRELHPNGDWDARRFRSTVLLDVDGDEASLVEQEWLGRTLTIGDVALEVTAPTPRCVMVTLSQQDLPADPDMLRTLARHNRIDVLGTGRFACLGAYASVTRTGTIHVGDEVSVSS